MSSASQPSGTVTFLFTDIEGSTRLWDQFPDAMGSVLERHEALLRATIEAHRGHVFKTVGDAFCAAFENPEDALSATLEAQRALRKEPWNETDPLRVRMALHAGIAQERDGDYFGAPLNLTARLLSIGHGEQVLVSSSVRERLPKTLSSNIDLRDMGHHHLKDLSRTEHVFQLVHPELPDQFPPLQSLENLPNNLPRQLSSFVGRELDIAETEKLLTHNRLVTLTGVGGVGKTRLGLQVAADVLNEFPDGVWFVGLAPLPDPQLVPQAIASAVGIRETLGLTLLESISDYLESRHLLLLLDNCEHLLDGCAQVVNELLRNCPDVRVLTTSRETLGIRGEAVWPVAPLSAPGLENVTDEGDSMTELLRHDAVKLFIERAALAEPSFRLTERCGPSVARVCRRLDGIPLALELAAARVRTLSVEDLADRLEDRFRLLTGGDRTAPPRQQTLKATIDWSYDLLSEEEQILLNRLSVFHRGLTLAAAEEVCSGGVIGAPDVLNLLSYLVQRSLVETEELDGGLRYWLLETVRQYSREKLIETGEAEQWRGLHAQFFLVLAEQAGPELTGARQQEALNLLECEHYNLRVALNWFLDNKVEDALRLAAALGLFWRFRGHLTEGRLWLGRAMDKSGAQGGLRAKGLLWAGVLAYEQGDYERARRFQRESLALAQGVGDKSGIASSLNNLGNVAYGQGDYDQTRDLYEESLALRRGLGDKSGIATSLSNLGNVAYGQGDYDEARDLYEESLALRRGLGDKFGIASSLSNLGNVAYGQGDYDEARDLYEESLTLRRGLGDKHGIATSLNNLGMAYEQGDYSEARDLYEESLALSRSLGDKSGIAISLNNLGKVAYEQGDYDETRDLCEESLALRRGLGDKSGIASSLNNLGNVAYEQGDHDEARDLYEESLALRRGLGEKSGIASSLNNLGNVAYEQGDYVDARDLYEKSLTLALEIGFKPGVALAMLGLACVVQSEGQTKHGARLLGASGKLFEEIGASLLSLAQRLYDRTEGALVEALGVEGFERLFAEGRAMPLEEAIELALDKRSQEG